MHHIFGIFNEKTENQFLELLLDIRNVVLYFTLDLLFYTKNLSNDQPLCLVRTFAFHRVITESENFSKKNKTNF